LNRGATINKKLWISEDILELIEKRRKYKNPKMISVKRK